MIFQLKHSDLFNPLLEAIRNLGGSGSIEELENEVARVLKLSDKEINDIHKGSRTKLSYRLAWARTYLKLYGLLDNSERGVWTFTETGKQIPKVIPEDVIEHVRKSKRSHDVTTTIEHEDEKEIDEVKWQDNVIEKIQNISPPAFERLCQRLLRESGFINVVVTGKSGDGGIDGKGIFRMGGVISFNVSFQAKRYAGNIPPAIVRDFRGAMQGKADKGLIITTGTLQKLRKMKLKEMERLRLILLMVGNWQKS